MESPILEGFIVVCVRVCVCVCVRSDARAHTLSCVQLFVNRSVHGIFHTRILEWVFMLNSTTHLRKN